MGQRCCTLLDHLLFARRADDKSPPSPALWRAMSVGDLSVAEPFREIRPQHAPKLWRRLFPDFCIGSSVGVDLIIPAIEAGQAISRGIDAVQLTGFDH